MPKAISQLDTGLFFLINQHLRNSFFDAVMPFITHWSYLIILPLLFAVFLRDKKDGLVIFVVASCSLLLADVAGSAVKHLIQRPRPCDVLENVHLLVGCGKAFSMPSNHATNSFAFAFPFVVMSGSRLRYLFAVVAALVCYSRVYVGAHYPADVLIGALLGSLMSMSVVYLYRWSERRFRDRPYTTVLMVFFLALSLFRTYFILDGPLDLSPDEAHYWEWSRRLDLSYYSKGPLIAYLIAAGTSLMGDTVFGVRFLAIVFSTLTSILLYRLGREFYGETTGTASALLFQVIPLYAPFGVIFTIDSPFLFFWVLSLYLFWKAIDHERCQQDGKLQGAGNSGSPLSGQLRSWLLLGLSIGLGLLTKYTMVFFIFSAFLFLIFSGEKRALLRTGLPYLSILAAFVVFSPVLIWNAQNGWVTIKHTAGQAHVAEGLRISIESFLEFVGSQLGVITPAMLVMMTYAIFRGYPSALSAPSAFLFWFSVPIVLFFVLKSLQAKVQANWAMTGYITGIIAFSELYVSRWKQNSPGKKRLVIIAVAFALALTAVAHFPATFSIPVKLDPSARLRGWQELGNEVAAIYSAMAGTGKVFIFSDSYQTSSELAFYVKGHPVTYCANLGRRMNQYDLWPGFHHLIHYDGIFVTIGDVDLDPRIREAFQAFDKRLLKVNDKGRPLREYSIFICRDFRGMRKEAIGSY